MSRRRRRYEGRPARPERLAAPRVDPADVAAARALCDAARTCTRCERQGGALYLDTGGQVRCLNHRGCDGRVRRFLREDSS